MTFIKTWSAAVLTVCAMTFTAPVAAQNAAQPKLPTVTLNAGMHNIVAEVARSPDERAAGLMFRREMAPHEGMLFIFEAKGQQCFWMKNTLLPLSIAFLEDDGTVVNIEDMAPQTTDPHCSTRPVRLVLEMNKGWFAKRGVKAGSRLSGTPFGAAR